MFIKVIIFSWKCLNANMVLAWGFFWSFLWLFSVILKRVSAFPAYCCLHNVHSIKYMAYALEQLTSWKILYVFRVCWLLKDNFVMTWLQHFCLFSLQSCFRFYYCQWQIRFLLRLKAVTDSFWKKIFQGFINWQYVAIFSNNFTNVWLKSVICNC